MNFAAGIFGPETVSVTGKVTEKPRTEPGGLELELLQAGLTHRPGVSWASSLVAPITFVLHILESEKLRGTMVKFKKCLSKVRRLFFQDHKSRSSRDKGILLKGKIIDNQKYR